MIDSFARKRKRLRALIFREWMTRYPDGLIGPYWAQTTTVLWIGFISLLFYFLDRSPALNVPTPIFVAAGVLPYLAFRQTVTSLSRSLIANRYLQLVQPVSAGEILLATSFVELLNLIASAMLIFGCLTFSFNWYLPDSFSQVLLGFVLTMGLAFAFGQLVARCALHSDGLVRLVPVVLRPMFWISGIFYLPVELPPAVRDILWFNPLFHAIEIVREGYFAAYQSDFAAFWYPITCLSLIYLISFPVMSIVTTRVRLRYVI